MSKNKKKIFLNQSIMSSNRGGLSAVVAEIILATIVLSLIIAVIIPSFNKNREMISIASKEENQLSNLKSQAILNLKKDTFSGNDVIATVRYYSLVDGVSVDVATSAGSYLYDGETYDENIFDIPRDDIYIISLTYENNKIQSVEFTPYN